MYSYTDHKLATLAKVVNYILLVTAKFQTSFDCSITVYCFYNLRGRYIWE